MRRATVALSTFRPLAAVVSWPVRATARKNFKSSQRMARVFCYACVLATMLAVSLHKCKMKMTKWRFRRTKEYPTHRVENRGGVATTREEAICKNGRASGRENVVWYM